jgi:hypothetical protein
MSVHDVKDRKQTVKDKRTNWEDPIRLKKKPVDIGGVSSVPNDLAA